MLPGGMMPVNQLIVMMRSSDPRGAVGLLGSMPADRLAAVVNTMKPEELARLLPAMKPAFLGRVAGLLADHQLVALTRVATTETAVALAATLPQERLNAVVGSLPDQVVLALMGKLSGERKGALREVVDPRRESAAQSAVYLTEVTEALRRSNVEVSVPDGVPEGILVVEILGWRIVVAVRFGDDGRVALRDAEHAAHRLRANGALSITDQPPVEDVLRYCRDERAKGRPVGAIAWADDRHDGMLKRGLVGLIH